MLKLNDMRQFLKNQYLPIFISLSCVLLLLFIVVQTVREFSIVNRAALASENKIILRPLVRLASQHLFGIYNAARLNQFPETKLPLTLQGTIIVTTNPKQSRALISTASNATIIYTKGQSVPGGAVIKKIQSDRIILNNHGQLESLRIPIPKLSI